MAISATLLIIAITAVVSFIAFSNLSLKERLLFYPFRIAKNTGEAYRFLTHGLIHADMGHLIFNMITLFFFGPYVESHFNANFGTPKGGGIYLAFYISAIIVSSLLSYFRQRNNSYYRSLGASGAVSAVLFASILLEPLSKIYIYFIPIGIPAYVFGPLYLIYTVYMDRRGNDNIGHDAHFMGAIYGLVATILLMPNSFSHFVEQIISVF